jgi:hypothetical protein
MSGIMRAAARGARRLESSRVASHARASIAPFHRTDGSEKAWNPSAAQIPEPTGLHMTFTPWGGVSDGEKISALEAKVRWMEHTMEKKIGYLERELRSAREEAATSRQRAVPEVPELYSRTTPESLPQFEALRRLRVVDLRALLKVRGCSTEGRKHDLVLRLDENRDAPIIAASGPAGKAASAASDAAWRKVQRDITPPKCKGHDEVCAVRVVKKNGPNFGRLFFACPRTKDDSCEFFQWTHLPRQTDKRGGVSSRKASRRVTEEEADLSRRATMPSKVSQDDLLSVNLSELMEEFTIVASGR